MEKGLSNSLEESQWIDGLQRKIRLRDKAIPELLAWLDSPESGDVTENSQQMVDIFQRIGRALEVRDIDVFDNENDDLEEPIFCAHAYDNLLHIDNKSEELLPIPVFSCIKPTQGASFLLHILLSMGRFETEIDLTLHENVKAYFRYAKLIGPNDDEE